MSDSNLPSSNFPETYPFLTPLSSYLQPFTHMQTLLCLLGKALPLSLPAGRVSASASPLSSKKKKMDCSYFGGPCPLSNQTRTCVLRPCTDWPCIMGIWGRVIIQYFPAKIISQLKCLLSVFLMPGTVLSVPAPIKLVHMKIYFSLILDTLSVFVSEWCNILGFRGCDIIFFFGGGAGDQTQHAR